MAPLLLQLGDQLLLVVQLVPEAADLLLVGVAVGVDLQLHGLLGRTKHRLTPQYHTHMHPQHRYQGCRNITGSR